MRQHLIIYISYYYQINTAGMCNKQMYLTFFLSLLLTFWKQIHLYEFLLVFWDFYEAAFKYNIVLKIKSVCE